QPKRITRTVKQRVFSRGERYPVRAFRGRPRHTINTRRKRLRTVRRQRQERRRFRLGRRTTRARSGTIGTARYARPATRLVMTRISRSTPESERRGDEVADLGDVLRADSHTIIFTGTRPHSRVKDHRDSENNEAEPGRLAI